MKQYKLIKKYPSLPDDWREGMLVGQGDRKSDLYYSPCSSAFRDRKICHTEVVNHPEFWQEVVEKDYEIITLVSSSSTNTIVENLYVGKSIESLLNEHFIIHSIRRLYDGEVFTVGDTVVFLADKPHMNCTSKIGSFRLENDEIKVLNEGCLISSLRNIQHVRKPLFTTEDGVDIYEGDEVTFVCLEDLRISGTCSTASITKENHVWDGSDGYLQFSTKEAAEEYILMNKPCLSINDVNKFIFETPLNSFYIDKLKKLVKSKL